MQWSKLKARAEAFFAPEVRARVALRAAVYRHAHDGEGRGLITVDGHEIWDAAYLPYFRLEGALIDELTEEAGISPSEAQPIARDRLAEQGIMSSEYFFQTIAAYCETSFHANLSSRNVLARGLAMLDRRLGKRRVAALDVAGEHPLVAELHRVRMDSIARASATR